MKKIDIMAWALHLQQVLVTPVAATNAAPIERWVLESVAVSLGLHPSSAAPLAGWAHHGFPSVRLDHSLAADLMLTSPPNEDELRMPWDVFLIEVPNGLVSMGDLEVAFVLVKRNEGFFRREVFFTNTDMTMISTTRLRRSVDQILTEGDAVDLSTMPTDDQVDRAFEMLDTLFANVCFAGTSAGGSGPGGSLVRKNGSNAQKTRHGAPVGIHYELGAPVLLKLDDRTVEEKRAMRGVVRNYIKTGRREFNGSYCRRGHWHNGLAPGVARTRDENGRWHFGPDRERKFRPPTMVNRDSGVVLVRDHVLKSA